MAAPQFSVVMPAHDAAATIAESIRSVRAQDHHDWELLLVDDASTDDTLDRARDACAGMDQRLTVVTTGSGSPAGPSVARNAGMDAAAGSYIAFLDADDVWEPVYLSARAEVLAQQTDAAMVWGPNTYWHPDQPERPDRIEGTEIDEPMKRFDRAEVVPLWLHSTRRTPCPGATVVRREAAVEAGGFPTELRRGEDIAMWFRLATAHPVVWDSRALFRYRRHGGSATSTSARDGTREAQDLEFMTWMARAVDEKGLHDCRAVAARNLHNAAELAAASLPPFRARWATAKAMLSVPVGRRYGWWLTADVLLPRSTARRAASVFHDWSGANSG